MTDNISRRGIMLVLSSPSGAGKTTLSRMLLEKDDSIKLSISVTTRPKRPAEKEGTDYFFLSEDNFKEKIANNQLLEYANVFGYYYGTPKDIVEDNLQSGSDVLFDIEWQGTQQLKQKAREDVVSIFILPPSREELERRLYTRAQDSEDVVQKRMSKANDEISHWAEYDYVIVNHDLEQSLKSIFSILKSERLKRYRQSGLIEFVKSLTS